MALSSTLKGLLWEDILASPFVSVLIDASTDISTSENMIMNMIIVYQKNGRQKVTYVELLHATEVDAEAITDALLDFFSSHGLAMCKVVGFCSD